MKKFFRLVALTVLVLMAGCVLLYGCTRRPDYEKLEESRQQFASENATLEKGQIVMVGDSIVYLLNEYPDAFEGLSLKVYNRGISGDVSDHVLSRLDDDVLALQPKAVSLLIGVNDLAYRYPQKQTVSNVRKIVEKCTAAGATVFVQSIYPVTASVNNGTARKNSRIRSANAQLRTLCDECGAIYIDIYSELVNAKGALPEALTYDGLHPNANGYNIIIEILRKYFANVQA